MRLPPSFIVLIGRFLIDFYNHFKNATKYIDHSHVNFDFNKHTKLTTRALDPAFDPTDTSNKANMASDNGPLLRSNWDGYCDEKHRTKQAFHRALLLAEAALDYLQAHDGGPTYQHYFGAEPVATVRGIFSALFNPDFREGDPIGEVANPKFKYMDLRYDGPRDILDGRYEEECEPDSGQTATLFEGAEIAPGTVTDPRRAFMIICPDAFAQDNLPVEDETGKKRCSTLRDTGYVSVQLDTYESTLLHEILHWDFMFRSVDGINNEHIIDYFAGEGDSLDPPNGYGPYHVVRIRARERDPIHNADSYVWFANEAWWLRKCGIAELRDPPPKADTVVTTPFDAVVFPDGTLSPPT